VIEVLWHGRGGQGAFTGARLLGAAYCQREGHHALAFPTFGPERRGAPMRAFTKLSAEKIGDRSALETADIVVYLDDTLFSADACAAQLRDGGVAVVNSPRDFALPQVLSFDANGISSELLGRAIPNTALLGALVTLLADLSQGEAEQAIRALMPPRLHEKNIAVLEAALERFEPKARSAGAAGRFSAEKGGAR
jgi:pyruvate ferredoxin oxidoreductase gamma subunit